MSQALDPLAIGSDDRTAEPRTIVVLVASIFILATCCIFYELLIGTVSSYLLGNSVTQFSFTIGFFMFFMGVGSFVSKYFTEDLLDLFVAVEIVIALAGGLSVALLHLAFGATQSYYLVAAFLIATISTLIGFEIPLVTRLAERHQPIKDALAHMLAFDYLGALVASLLFPLVLLPYLGLMQTSFAVGLMNIGIVFVNLAEFSSRLKHLRRHLVLAIGVTIVLIAGFASSFRIVGLFERMVFEDEIVHSEQTRYQKIVMTKHADDVRLFINGDLQFCTLDEHRYHEPLVHVPLSWAGKKNREHVLVLGGGDGLALREILKYDDVRRITLVDLDERMTHLAQENAVLSALNNHSLSDPRVSVVNEDAFNFVERTTELYSIVIIDLPDPNDLALGKLYSKEFYQLLRKKLAKDAIIVTQSTSPYLARVPFWSINHTLKGVFPHVVPYTTYVPSFGQWGFNAASERPLDPRSLRIEVPTRYLTAETLPTLFVFDSDMNEVPAEENRLDKQILIQYYEASGDRWN